MGNKREVEAVTGEAGAAAQISQGPGGPATWFGPSLCFSVAPSQPQTDLVSSHSVVVSSRRASLWGQHPDARAAYARDPCLALAEGGEIVQTE